MYVNRRRQRKDSGQVLIMAIIFTMVLLLVGYSVQKFLANKKTTAGNSSTTSVSTSSGEALIKNVSTTTLALEADPNTWRRFVAEKGGYEVRFPRSLFTWAEADVSVPPNYNEKIKSVKLSHTVPVQYCGLSGLPEHCSSTTENMSVSFVVVGKSFNDVFSSLKKMFGSKLPIVTIDGHQGVKIETGAEGEGVVYYVLPDGPYTIFIAWKYLNEEIWSKYQTETNFIKYKDQAKIFTKILGTFKFSN